MTEYADIKAGDWCMSDNVSTPFRWNSDWEHIGLFCIKKRFPGLRRARFTDVLGMAGEVYKITGGDMTDNIELSPDFWDCECRYFYIHSKREESCPRCGVHRDEMPDSRINEIEHFMNLGMQVDMLVNIQTKPNRRT